MILIVRRNKKQKLPEVMLKWESYAYFFAADFTDSADFQDAHSV